MRRLGDVLDRPYPPLTASAVGPDLLAVDGVGPLVGAAAHVARFSFVLSPLVGRR